MPRQRCGMLVSLSPAMQRRCCPNTSPTACFPCNLRTSGRMLRSTLLMAGTYRTHCRLAEGFPVKVLTAAGGVVLTLNGTRSLLVRCKFACNHRQTTATRSVHCIRAPCLQPTHEQKASHQLEHAPEIRKHILRLQIGTAVVSGLAERGDQGRLSSVGRHAAAMMVRRSIETW